MIRLLSLVFTFLLVFTPFTIFGLSGSANVEFQIRRIFNHLLDGYQLTAWDYHGRLLAFACDNKVYIVDTHSNSFVRNITLESMVYSLKFLEFDGLKLFIGFGKSWFLNKYKPLEEITVYGPIFRSIGNESFGFAVYDLLSYSMKIYYEIAIPIFFDIFDGKLLVGLSNGLIRFYSTKFIVERSINISYGFGFFLNYKIYPVNFSDGTRYLIIASAIKYIYGYGFWIYLCPPPAYTRTFSVVAFVDENFNVTQSLHLSSLYDSIPYWWLGFAYEVIINKDKFFVATEFDVYKVFYNNTSGAWEYSRYCPTGVRTYIHYMYGFAKKLDLDGDLQDEFLIVTSMDIFWYYSRILIWDNESVYEIANFDFPIYDIELRDNTAIVLTNDSFVIADFKNNSLSVKAKVGIPLWSLAIKYLWMIPFTLPMKIFYEQNNAIIIVADLWRIAYSRLDISSEDSIIASLNSNLYSFGCIPHGFYKYGYYLPRILNTNSILRFEMGLDNFILYNNSIYSYGSYDFVYGGTRYILKQKNNTLIIRGEDIISNDVTLVQFESKFNLSKYYTWLLAAGSLDIDLDSKGDFVAFIVLSSFLPETNDTLIILVNSSRYGLEIDYVNITGNLSYVYTLDPLDIIYNRKNSNIEIIGSEGILRIKITKGKPVSIRYQKLLGINVPVYHRTDNFVVIANPLNLSTVYSYLRVYNLNTTSYIEFFDIDDYTIRGGKIVVSSAARVTIITLSGIKKIWVHAVSVDIIGNDVYMLSWDSKLLLNGKEIATLNLTDPLHAKIATIGEFLAIFDSNRNNYRVIVYDSYHKKIIYQQALNGTLLNIYRENQKVILFLRDNIVEVSIETHFVYNSLQYYIITSVLFLVILAMAIKFIKPRKNE